MAAFRADTHPQRVSLGAGVYCADDGKSQPLEVVELVEKTLHKQLDVCRHDYLPIEGDQQFLASARKLIFAATTGWPADLHPPLDPRVVSVQTISGTGANHLGARFLAETLKPRHVWLSNPTWANHHTIWESVGVPQRSYPYYNASTNTMDFTAMMDVLENEAKPRDVIVLHACAHNPTGLDPTHEQWEAIAELCQRKNLFPFFDSAYQGFATGDLDNDSWAVRHFYNLQPCREMMVAQSFSKNFGLYGQRAGALHVVVNSLTDEERDMIVANLSHLIRTEYSVPPRYGSTIVKTVLSSEILFKHWLEGLRIMSGRIRAMRVALYDELCRIGTPGDWEHIIDQVCIHVSYGPSIDQS
jgi:aspartate aminotransferase, cytoplasmic